MYNVIIQLYEIFNISLNSDKHLVMCAMCFQEQDAQQCPKRLAKKFKMLRKIFFSLLFSKQLMLGLVASEFKIPPPFGKELVFFKLHTLRQKSVNYDSGI